MREAATVYRAARAPPRAGRRRQAPAGRTRRAAARARLCGWVCTARTVRDTRWRRQPSARSVPPTPLPPPPPAHHRARTNRGRRAPPAQRLHQRATAKRCGTRGGASYVAAATATCGGGRAGKAPPVAHPYRRPQPASQQDRPGGAVASSGGGGRSFTRAQALGPPHHHRKKSGGNEAIENTAGKRANGGAKKSYPTPTPADKSADVGMVRGMCARDRVTGQGRGGEQGFRSPPLARPVVRAAEKRRGRPTTCANEWRGLALLHSLQTDAHPRGAAAEKRGPSSP